MGYRRAYRRKDGTFVSSSWDRRGSSNFGNSNRPNFLGIIVIAVFLYIIVKTCN